MTRALILALALLVSGCAGGQALITTDPTPEQVQAVRQTAIRTTVAVETALGILDETGRLLDSLPIPDSAKDRYDCAILAVTGTAQPASLTVTRVCGAVPLSTVAPLPMALESLRGVTACPSLRTTLSSLYGWTAPLITQLEAAENAALRMAGASLRVTLAILSSGGVACQ
jgi:hypothetical protein